MKNTPWKVFFVGAFILAFSGCATGIRGVNITQALYDDPDFMMEFMPHSARQVDELKLGGEYELLHDMWLIRGGNQARNRYRLRMVGKSIHTFPRDREAFEKRPRHYRDIVDGVVDEGTVLRAVRVEYFRPSIHGSSFAGIVFQIQNGTHIGKLILGIGEIMLTHQLGRFDGQTNPEFLREIKPPYLNAAGLPLVEEGNESEREGD